MLQHGSVLIVNISSFRVFIFHILDVSLFFFGNRNIHQNDFPAKECRQCRLRGNDIRQGRWERNSHSSYYIIDFHIGVEQARVHDLETAGAILDIFQKYGHNEVDTARAYGAGSSEEMLGDLGWQKRGIVMDTKYYPTIAFSKDGPSSESQRGGIRLVARAGRWPATRR